jgi:tetratricopeptide (TPR) repeat protein
MAKQKFITVFVLILLLFPGFGEKDVFSQIIPSQNAGPKNEDPLSQLTPCNRAIAEWRYDEAVALCTQEIDLSPRSAEAYHSRGIVYYLKQNYDAAIADYDKAISLDPKGRSNFYANRGMAYIGKGLFDKAFSDLDRAISMDPKDFRAYGGRGRAYAGRGDLDRAIADYTRSLELDPWPDQSGITRADRGDAYFAKEQYESALFDYQKALGSFPDDPYTLLRIGRSLYRLERFGEAQQSFQTGLKNAKEENLKADLRYELAMSHAALGEYAKVANLLGEKKIIGLKIAKLPNGFNVVSVQKGAPADLAGIRPKDILVDFNGEKLAALDVRQFIEKTLQKPKFGSIAKVVVLRNGAYLEKKIVVGMPANLTALVREEDAPRMPGVSPVPLILIRKIEIKPAVVPPGGRFDLILEYSVGDPALKEEQLPVQFSFSILQGEKTLYSQAPTNLMSRNSQNTTRTEPLNASNRKGVYLLKVLLTYQNYASEKSVELRIE